MKCDRCHRVLSPDEPVWHGGTGIGAIDGRCKTVGSLCRQCAEYFHWLDDFYAWKKWRAPRPCKICGRPLHWSDQRPVRKHFVCSPECARRAYYPKLPLPARACVVCGDQFVP